MRRDDHGHVQPLGHHGQLVSTQEGSSVATGGSSSTNPTSSSSQETSSSSSQQEATDGLKFTLSSDKQSYAVSGYTGASASVFIPETYEGLPVTSIGEYAFHGCIKLTGITLPGSLRNISANAFEGCTGITDVSLPASVTSIGYGAFSGCTGLTSFAVDPANAKFETDGKALYDKGKTELVCYALGLSGAYAVADTVTIVNSYSFEGCTGLTGITLPAAVTIMGSYAFRGCTSLSTFSYEGTMGQWGKISKGSDWNKGTLFTEVTCSDGTVTL